MTPADTAAGLFSLARETGWSVEYLLWQLPLSLYRQACHVFMARRGIRVRRRGFVTASERGDMLRMLGI